MANKTYTAEEYTTAARARSKYRQTYGVGGASLTSGGGTTTIVSTTTSGDGHTHANKDDLDKLSVDTDRYISITQSEEQSDGTYESVTDKAKAGYADEAGKADTADKATEADHATLADTANDLAENAPILDTVLRSDREDEAEEVITFLKGLKIGENGEWSITAEGIATLKSLIAETIQATDITADYLTVTKKAHFFELVIDKLKSVGGTVLLTGANCKLDLVEAMDENNNVITDDTTPDHWRCYWLAKDSDGQAISNDWEVGDQALSYTTNFAEGTSYDVSNRYWWRLVTAIDSGAVTKTLNGVEQECHWMDISNTTYDSATGETGLDSDAPQAGDSAALLGSRNDDETRRNAIVLASTRWIDNGRAAYTDSDGTTHAAIKALQAPMIVQYEGISSFALADARLMVWAASGNVLHGEIEITTAGLESITHWAYSNTLTPADTAAPDGTEWVQGDAGGSQWKYMGTVSDHTTGDSHLTFSDYSWVALDVAADAVTVVIFTDSGNIIRNSSGSVTLTAIVYKGGEEVSSLSDGCFSWFRTTANTESDEAWNALHSGVGNTITVTAAEVWQRALFECQVTI